MSEYGPDPNDWTKFDQVSVELGDVMNTRTIALTIIDFAARKIDARINKLILHENNTQLILANWLQSLRTKFDARIISVAARKYDARIINVAARARANQVSS